MRAAAALERVSPRLVLAGGALVLLALRLALSLARSGPVIMADEAGYLLHARVLAGGMAAEMGSSPFYRGGYALLIAPVLAMSDDPVLAYHGALVVNALLTACLVPLLYLLLTRCAGVARPAAAWAAVAGAAYPSITALSQVALAENLLFVLTAAWLLAARPTPSVAWAVATGLCAAALWTAHGRMIVVVALTGATLCWCALAQRRRGGADAAVAGFVALAAGLASGMLLNGWLLDRNYGGAAPSELERVRASLGDVDGVMAVLTNLAGHGWYVLVATLGLALVLFVEDVPRAAARLVRRRPEPADPLLALVALATLGLLAASALWLAVRDRPDQLVYGRYVEPVVPILVALGIVALARAGRDLRRRRLALGLLGLTAIVALVRLGLDLPVAPSRWNVAALPAMTGALGPAVIALAGVVATGALLLLAAVARRAPAALGPVVLVLFVPTTAYLAVLPVLRSEHDVYPAGWTSPRDVVERAGAASVGYDLDAFDHIAVKTYQWALPHTRVVLFEGPGLPPRSLFFSGRAPRREVLAAGGRIVWSDPGRDQVLWQIGGR